MTILEIKILILLFSANGAPIIGTKIFAEKWQFPVDFNANFIDSKPLLGKSKTYRGLILSLLLTSAIAPILGLPALLGFSIALLSMLGDMLSSFIKRRLNFPSSNMALGLDQIPEALLPVLVLQPILGLDMYSIARLIVVFFILNLALSKILYHLNIRSTPY